LPFALALFSNPASWTNFLLLPFALGLFSCPATWLFAFYLLPWLLFPALQPGPSLKSAKGLISLRSVPPKKGVENKFKNDLI